MPECPRCHQPVDSTAIDCPYCRTPLKAYGHPGIPLHRASGQEPLCLTCVYHEDDTCNYSKRPSALDCTMYHDRTKPITPLPSRYPNGIFSRGWLRRNLGWLVLIGLVLLSLMLAVLQ